MKLRRLYSLTLVILVLTFFSSTPNAYSQSEVAVGTPTAEAPNPALAPPAPDAPLSTCTTSTPPSGAYSVALCFTAPTAGAVISGDAAVSTSISVTGTSPGITRVYFTINGGDLLMDYLSPYGFTLPSAKWQDGVYNLGVVAVMRDGYTTANQATLALTFSNGNTQTPVNPNTFTPSNGTNPPSGSPFIVAAAGDGADGATNAANVVNRLTTINPNLFLYLGDVYSDGTYAEFYNWYGAGAINFGKFYSITNPTIGNHEYTGNSAPGYFDYWNNVPNYYSYNAGGWHFISLNSNSSRIGVDRNSAQYAWLAQDLAANASLCTIVYYHHPVFNIGPEGPTTAMSDIWALLAQNSVSMVINGHDHDYQRWVPLDANGQPSSTGVTEFVAGGGGHGLQTILGSDTRVAYSNDINPQAFGVLKLALNTQGANFEYVNTSGAILDSGAVSCSKAGTDTQPPSTPGGLSGNAVSATQVNLAWQASTDNVGVTGYTVYRDNTALATVSGSTLSYSDNTALPSTTYSYSVDAFDAAGNHSSFSAPVSVTTPALPSSLTFNVGADTYVNSGSPTSNYGSTTVWRVDGSPDLHAYLRFTVQGLAGSSIQSAVLKVYANSSSSLGIKALAVADNTWGEKTVTYNTAPPLGAVLASSAAIASGTWISLDVTPYISGEGTYSFGINTPSSTTLSFAARESGVNAALLVVNLGGGADTQPPSVPTGLTATAVSATQVNLTWQASTDNVGVNGYSIYRDSAPLAIVSGSTLNYSDNTVLPTTTYSYSVDAFDTAGNHSAASSPVSVTTPALPSNLTFSVAADTYVNASSPTANYGSSTAWRVDGSPDMHAYLRFTVQGLAGRTVQHAYLKVYASTSSSLGIRTLAVADNTWGEKTVTYNTAPSLGILLGSSGAITSGSWVTIEVTGYITADGTYSFGINTPSSTTIKFSSKESGANGAQLVIILQ